MIRSQAQSSEAKLSLLTKTIIKSWETIEEVEPIVQKDWKPKNPEVAMPVAADVSLSKRQWKEANFPSFSMPDEVTTHVNTKLWGLKVKEVQANPKDKNFIPILEKVYKDLVEGSDSKVGPPGSNASKSPNFFPEPEVDIP